MTMPDSIVTTSVTIATAFSGENVKGFFIRVPQALARNIGSLQVCIPPHAAPGSLSNITHAVECRGVSVSFDQCTAFACSRETSRYHECDIQIPGCGRVIPRCGLHAA